MNRRDRDEELRLATVQALLIGFTKPIRYAYKIPNYPEGNITKAIQELYFKEGELQNTYLRMPWRGQLKPSRIGKRVVDGLEKVFEIHHRDDYTPFDHYLLQNERTFATEWFYGLGNIYAYRRGGLKKAKDNVRSFWTDKERAEFGKINATVRRDLAKKYARVSLP